MYLLVLLSTTVVRAPRTLDFWMSCIVKLNNLKTTRQVNDVAILLFMADYKPCDGDLQDNYSEYRQKRKKKFFLQFR